MTKDTKQTRGTQFSSSKYLLVTCCLLVSVLGAAMENVRCQREELVEELGNCNDSGLNSKVSSQS